MTRSPDSAKSYRQPSIPVIDGAPPIALSLRELVVAPSLQAMMDDFYELTHIPSALIDTTGYVVVGSGWQDVCTRFHRVHPETCAYCIESDTVLTAEIPEGEPTIYRCKNGMWDAATPVIVAGERLGALFTGQFFFADEPVDLDFFAAQARRYGFDENEYLTAVQSVPKLSRETVELGLRFLTQLSGMISQLSFMNLQRERAEQEAKSALEGQTTLTSELQAERGVLDAVMENTDAHLAYLDADFNFTLVNSTYARGSGHTKEELIGRNHFELFPDAENMAIFERVRDTGEPMEFRAKPYEFPDQPWRGVTYWDWRLTPVKDADGSLHGLAYSLQDVTHAVRDQLFGQAINRLNDVIHANLDFDSLLSEFAPQMASAVGCEAVAIALRRSDGTWRFREVIGAQESDIMQRVFADKDLPLAVQALETGRPLVLSDEPSRRSVARRLGFKSTLVAPLFALNRPLGTIACGFTSGPGTFDDEQIDFVARIASSLSLALQNAQLYEAEHRIADRLQEALLSLPPEIAGVDFATAYHSAAEVARVGGDFYDVFPLGGDRVGVTIGDVAGKGIDAAVLTSFAKNTIRAYAAENGKPAAEVLSLTNALLYETTPRESFVTVFFGVLDRCTGSLEWANAGHTSPVLMTSAGGTELLTSTGPILGAFSHVKVEQHEAEILLGDVLFMYTDGLIEARDGTDMYGEEGLLRFLAGAKSVSLNELVEGAVDDVVAFTKVGLSDDVAILALSRNDEGVC